MPTPNELAARIEQSLEMIPKIVANGQVLATNDILGSMLRRIFNEGKRTDGANIGSYSTKNTFVGAKSFRNKSAADSFFSSADDLQWVKYKGRSLAVLPGGYKRLREVQGLPSGFVNFEYSGALKQALDIGTANGEAAIGLTTAKSVDIVRGLEKKFGKTFSPQQEEIDIAIEVASEYMLDEFSKMVESWL